MIRSAIISILAFFCVSILGIDYSHAGETITIGGGGGTIASIFAVVKEPFEEETGIKLVLLPTTPQEGLLELHADHLDVTGGMISLASLVNTSAIRDKKISAAAFKEHALGDVKLIAMTHRNNPVTSLSDAQLKGLFTGKIKNWRDVGGENLDVVIVWGNTPGQNALFSKMMLDNEPVAGNMVHATNYADIRAKVATTPGAIGIDPEGFASSTIRKPEIPIIATTAYAFTKGEPSPKVKTLFKYIKMVDLRLKRD